MHWSSKFEATGGPEPALRRKLNGCFRHPYLQPEQPIQIQFSERLKKITDKPDITAEYLEERTGDVKHSQADNTRAKEWLGYEKLVDLEEGLRNTIDWWKNSRFAA